MARTVVAVFDSFYSADKAVQELRSTGLPHEMIDIFTRPVNSGAIDLARTPRARAAKPEIHVDGQSSGIRIGAGIGLAIGIAGSLLGLSGVLPLFTMVLKSGLLADASSALALAGVVSFAGGVLGGALGGAVGLGIPESELLQYACKVCRSEVLVAVLADWDAVDPVLQIFGKHNPLAIEQKSFSDLKIGRTARGAGQNVHVERRKHREDHR